MLKMRIKSISDDNVSLANMRIYILALFLTFLPYCYLWIGELYRMSFARMRFWIATT